jgi:hypothetical protein
MCEMLLSSGILNHAAVRFSHPWGFGWIFSDPHLVLMQYVDEGLRGEIVKCLSPCLPIIIELQKNILRSSPLTSMEDRVYTESVMRCSIPAANEPSQKDSLIQLPATAIR